MKSAKENIFSTHPVYITQALRTPIGSFQGAFSDIPAPQLGAAVIRELLERQKLENSAIDYVIMGEVLTAGVGQAPARQAAIAAGLSSSVPCMTINKVCGSGLQAVMLGADQIALGYSEVVIAGGQENMTLAPHILLKSRNGYRMGHAALTDSMIHDGLWDPYNQWHMGNAAELCVREKNFTREEQDAFAVESYTRAQKAQKDGVFQKEILKFEIKAHKPGASSTWIEQDEEPFKTKFDKIPSLKPAFDKAGTITAANASKINDGAAAVTLMSQTALQKHPHVKPIARVIAHAVHAQDPKWFTTAPVQAMQKACQQAQININDIDIFEVNEAFAVVALAAQRDLKIPSEKLNVFGGAIALGHPIGASGARLLTTLIHALHTRQQKYGMVSLCIGGGEAVAMIVERVNDL